MVEELSMRLLPADAAQTNRLHTLAAEMLQVDHKQINGVRIVRRSIDARQRQVWVNVRLRVWIDEPMTDEPCLSIDNPIYKKVHNAPSAVIVGFGPGGIFAALRLIELGIRPIVVERGRKVSQRKRDIAQISRKHLINPESNYAFGEGGAGAFSDGKLYTRSRKRGSIERVLRILTLHGADPAIEVDTHPHIGTDKLPGVIETMRKQIESCGGEIHFETRMTDLLCKENHVTGIVCQGPSGEVELHGSVILATGHSARDVYHIMLRHGADMEAKGIAMGVRLEHPQSLIDQIQYHSVEGRGEHLPPAEYSYSKQVNDRGVYSFCMCPGGVVVPAASGMEELVVNGMSSSSRTGRWANAGWVVEIRPEDVGGDPADVLRVLRFQEKYERLAWDESGRTQHAPAQRMEDFVCGCATKELPHSSYAPGLIISALHKWLPPMIGERLREGFAQVGRETRGFLTNEALLIGVESRTSSPVRIVRDSTTLENTRLRGIYPCGEGAGYAGGIVSAAIDGERCAEQLAQAIIKDKPSS